MKLRIVRAHFAVMRRYPRGDLAPPHLPAARADRGIIALLAFDLFFARRGEDDVSLRRAAGWSGWWMAVGVAFGLSYWR